jgi:hypothetical protein
MREAKAHGPAGFAAGADGGMGGGEALMQRRPNLPVAPASSAQQSTGPSPSVAAATASGASEKVLRVCPCIQCIGVVIFTSGLFLCAGGDAD